jgi:hypothetical protein
MFMGDGTANRRGFLRRSVGIAVVVPCIASSGARAVDRRASALGSLLARNQNKHPGQRVSNHTSMALLSLAALGSSDQHLRELGEHHLSRWAPFPESGPAVDARGWREQLGNTGALFGFRALFRQEIQRRGVPATLRLYLPGLLPGLGAHAFHAIIRTGYGVRFDDAEEVAMGLAYWAVTYLPLGPLAQASSGQSGGDPLAALAAVRDTPVLTREGRQAAGIVKPDGMNIAGNMQWASSLAGFAPAAALRLGPGSLAGIARATLGMYLGSRDNFTALHAVTGTHAYRMIEPFVPDRTAGRRYLWQALVAAYVSIGAPVLNQPAPAQLPGWAEVAARAAASNDDHEIKLTDIAREESRHWNESGQQYLRAAATHLGLV